MSKTKLFNTEINLRQSIRLEQKIINKAAQKNSFYKIKLNLNKILEMLQACSSDRIWHLLN